MKSTIHWKGVGWYTELPVKSGYVYSKTFKPKRNEEMPDNISYINRQSMKEKFDVDNPKINKIYIAEQ